jgi:anti-anti-sigma factor
VLLQIGYEERDGGIAVVTAAGRLMQGPEGERVEAVVRELLSRGVRRIILDFSGLTHIDSTGIGRTIAGLNLVMQQGAKMVVAGAKGSVREAFRVTQLDRVFRFYDDLESAEAAVRG